MLLIILILKNKNKSYKLEDILVENNDRNLGIFQDKDVILKKENMVIILFIMEKIYL